MKPHPDNDIRLYLLVTLFVCSALALGVVLMVNGL
jgi:hypothetical protein